MRRYNNSVVLQFDSDTTGNGGADVPVTVRDSSTKAIVTIYSANEQIPANEKANPLTTGPRGNYDFFVPDGMYDIVIDEGNPAQFTLFDVQIYDQDVLTLPFNFTASQGQTEITLPDPTAKVEVFIDTNGFQFEGAYTHISGTDLITMSEAFQGGETVQVNYTSIISSSNPMVLAGSFGNPYLFDSTRILLNSDLSSYPFKQGDWIQTKGKGAKNDGGGASFRVINSGNFDYETIIPLTASFNGELVNGTRQVIANGSTTEIVAHRGFAKTSVESTRYALESAIRYGANSLECDVQFTSDGFPIIFHDTNMQDLLNGVTGTVPSNTIADVRNATFKELDSNINQSYVRILELPELLDMAQEYGVNVNIEFKLSQSNDNIKTVIDAVLEKNMQNMIIFHSFKLADIQYARSYNQDIRIAFLCTRFTGNDTGGVPIATGIDWVKRDKNSSVAVSDVGVDFDEGGFAEVVALQAAGVVVYMWTAENSIDVLFGKRNNVNAIITDIPLVKQAIRVNHGTSI